MKALTSLKLPAVMSTEICDNVEPDDEIFLVKMEEKTISSNEDAASSKEKSGIGK